MKLPPDIAAVVIKAAAKEIADRMQADGLDDLKIITIKHAAAILMVSVPIARRLIAEYVEPGESSKRVSLAILRRMIEDRTIPGK